MSVRRATPDEMPAVRDIRREVFIVEQKVPEEEEYDNLDDTAIHLVALDGTTPVGTARLLVEDTTGKIGRVAVLRSHRGSYLGQALIRAALDEFRAMGLTTAKLGAQTHALGFYSKLGFTAYGPEYMDAGIPHRDMTHSL